MGRTVDADGNPSTTGDLHQTVYVFDNGQVVLQFEKTGAGNLDAADLSNRYLWGAAVDQLLADEQVDWTGGEADGDTLWALTDHLGTVRDLVDDAGTLQNHKTYDAFGNVTAETNAAVDTVFGYTGKLFDDATGLQNNWHRWYDARVGSWISEDWIRDDVGNSYRYVGNEGTIAVDDNGLERKYPWDEVHLGMYHVNGTANLLAHLAGNYAVPGKSIGEWFTQDDTTYVQYITDAFDTCKPFQLIVVQTEKLEIQGEVMQRLREHVSGPDYPPTFSFDLDRDNLQDEYPIALGSGGGALAWALNSPYRLDVQHHVSVTQGKGNWQYSVRSQYVWHDECDWNSLPQLVPQQESFFGYLWAGVEGSADLVMDKILDMNYYFSLYYSQSFQAIVPGLAPK